MYETKEECDKGKSVNIEVDKENTKEKGNRSRKIKSKIIFEMIAILAILYVGMSIYFMNHFNIGTFINDENYGGRSPRYVDNEIMEMIDNYQLKIIGRNNIENIIKGNEIKLKYHPDDTLTEIMKSQNGWSTIFSKSFMLNSDLKISLADSMKSLLGFIGNLSHV